jgi:transposase
MESGIGEDLAQASPARLREIIAQQQRVIEQQQAVIEQLQTRIAELETRLGRSGGRGMPGLKPPGGAGASATPRKQRPEGFGRQRAAPTEQVEHAMEACPTCGTTLVGGAVKRTREVIELGPSPLRIIEHVYRERRCPLCGTRWVPKVDLTGQVLGHQRLGLGLVSLIVTLREEGRLPIRTIQWYLATMHHLHLSVGAIVAAGARAAQQGQDALEQIRARVRASPVAHADETGWREDGHNGYVWTFSTPTERYFVRGNREKGMVDRVLGDAFSGVLVSDFYAAYNHYHGLKQRCWAHLLQDIHELQEFYPDDASVQAWAQEISALYQQAKAFSSPKDRARLTAKVRFERRALAICAPYRENPAAAQRRLSARITRFIEELFLFVLYPEVPSHNNAAEKSLRHLVTCRKISGGTRSAAGTLAKMALSSLFGTWRARHLDPLLSCRQMLAYPQV